MWAKVTEILPNRHVRVLVRSADFDCGVGVAWRTSIGWDDGDATVDTVTHWMPLPEPPR